MSEITFIGSTILPNNTGDTTIALPAGTLPGDHLVLSMAAGWLAGSMPTTSDARMTTVHTYPPLNLLLAHGLATSSTAPVAFTSADSEGNGKVVLMAFRGPVGSDVDIATSVGFAGSHATPVLPETDVPAIVATIITHNYGEADADISPPSIDAWTRQVLTGGSAQNQNAYTTDAALPLAYPTVTVDWLSLVVTFTPVTPPPPPPPYDEANGEDIEFGNQFDLGATGDPVIVVVDDTSLLFDDVIYDNLAGPSVEGRYVIVESLPYEGIVLVFFHLDGGSPSDPRDRFFDGGGPGDSPTRDFDGGAP